jgi:hypothetical protein
MLSKQIIYFGCPYTLVCDGNCRKAWGVDNRPSVYFDANGNIVAGKIWKPRSPANPQFSSDGKSVMQGEEPPDYDDYAYLADHELGEAPESPGTWEGTDGKPDADDPSAEKLNRWCARQCERSDRFASGEQIIVPSFLERSFNMPSSKKRDEQRALCGGVDLSLEKARWNGKTFIKL